MRTARDIEYKAAPYGFIARIPKGTKVEPATNQPEPGKFWAIAWPDMTETARAWHENYGFLLDLEELDFDA